MDAEVFLQSAGAEVELRELGERGLAGAVRDVNLEIRTGEVFLSGGFLSLGKSPPRLIEPNANEILANLPKAVIAKAERVMAPAPVDGRDVRGTLNCTA